MSPPPSSASNQTWAHRPPTTAMSFCRRRKSSVTSGVGGPSVVVVTGVSVVVGATVELVDDAGVTSESGTVGVQASVRTANTVTTHSVTNSARSMKRMSGLIGWLLWGGQDMRTSSMSDSAPVRVRALPLPHEATCTPIRSPAASNSINESCITPPSTGDWPRA